MMEIGKHDINKSLKGNELIMNHAGNGQLTIEEQRTHFAAWCFFKSPILLGTDVSVL